MDDGGTRDSAGLSFSTSEVGGVDADMEFERFALARKE
jgi:hypothetical protein